MQTSEKEMLQKEQKGKGVAKDASEEILYKIDIPANRYDMLCLEGIARALNIFNQRLSKVQYRLANMQGAHLLLSLLQLPCSSSACAACASIKDTALDASAFKCFGESHELSSTYAGKRMERLVIKPETALVRPFAVAAILRGITFDPVRYQSFIDLQDKLHQNLCRQRSLVAIGTHDLATLQV